ncbi:MAG: hypothetical protein FD169_2325 [Bacillota bacterium]|nr:MAG: hypothetical protein FD169_2325 [Bacillota bacterium]
MAIAASLGDQRLDPGLSRLAARFFGQSKVALCTHVVAESRITAI